MQKKQDYEINGKQVNVGQVFCVVPKLKSYFSSSLNYIVNYEKYKWKNTTKEALMEKDSALLNTFINLDIVDLQTVYLIRNINGLGRTILLRKLQAIYEAEIELSNELELKEALKNPLKIVSTPEEE